MRQISNPKTMRRTETCPAIIPFGTRCAGLAAGALFALTALTGVAAGPTAVRAGDDGATSVALISPAVIGSPAIDSTQAKSCPLRYDLPGDIDTELPTANSHGAFDK